MKKWTESAAVAVFILGLVLYAAAKVDFFRHYNPNDVGGYVAEHSKYWLGMAILAGLLLILYVAGRRRSP